jgi:hypothetical protein
MPRDTNHRFAKDARESATLATLALTEADEDVAREASQSFTIGARRWNSSLPDSSRPKAIQRGEGWPRR